MSISIIEYKYVIIYQVLYFYKYYFFSSAKGDGHLKRSFLS